MHVEANKLLGMAMATTNESADLHMLTESFLSHSDIYHEPFKCSSCEEEDGKGPVHSQSLPPCHLPTRVLNFPSSHN